MVVGRTTRLAKYITFVRISIERDKTHGKFNPIGIMIELPGDDVNSGFCLYRDVTPYLTSIQVLRFTLNLYKEYQSTEY